MPAVPSEDEFDALPDDFEGVDFDAVPDLARQQSLPEAPTPLPDAPQSPGIAANASSEYSFDDIDASFLAEADIIEDRASRGENTASGSNSSAHVSGSRTTADPTPSDTHVSRYFVREASGEAPRSRAHTEARQRKPSAGSSVQIVKSDKEEAVSEVGVVQHPLPKRERASASPPIPNKKGKMKEEQSETSDSVRQILEALEDEMTCPICCDIFVAAHLGNPCGHSFCGDCGWQWISKNKRAPSCAVCRAKLSANVPMIPNFAVDNTVEKHIRALGSSGNVQWQSGGSKIAEWNARQEKWKKEAAERAAQPKTTTSRRRRVPARAPVIDDDWLVPDDENDDEEYVEEQFAAMSRVAEDMYNQLHRYVVHRPGLTDRRTRSGSRRA